MSMNFRRAGAIGLAAAVVSALAVAGAGTANAATTLGTIVASPMTALVDNPFNMVTSGLCPDGTDGLTVRIDNGSTWNDVVLVGNNDTEINNINTTGLAAGDTLSSTASTNGLTLANGHYGVRLDCKSGFVDVLGSFAGGFTIAGTTYTWDVPAGPAASTTTLVVDPANTAAVGADVTLGATVTSSGTVAGTVQFLDGTTNLGTPATVTNGSASFTTNALTAGDHTLTAKFIPTDANTLAASTSVEVPYTIGASTGGGAVATTTTLAASPAAPTTADTIVLTAALAPTTAVGSVDFKEGDTVVGTAPVSGGTASASLTGVTAGDHSYTAVFTPTSTDAFTTSTSAAQTVTVTTAGTGGGGVTASETLTTKVDSGTLTITAGGNTVDLGTLALNSDNSKLVSAPTDINPVTVTDTRAGSPGWNVNGSVADFSDGASGTISGDALGWTPKVVSSDPSQTVTAGSVVAPGTGIKTPQLLGSAATGASAGTAELGATLELEAPTSATAGTYTTTLTLTAI